MTRVRLLTGAVIGMGVLILAGLVALVIGIVNKAGDDGRGATPDTKTTRHQVRVPLVPRTGVESLNLPTGAIVLKMTAVSSGLVVLVKMPSGEQIIYMMPLYKKQKPFRINLTKPSPKK